MLLLLGGAIGSAGEVERPEPIRIAAISCESRVRDTRFNLERIEHWARKAEEAKADLALFPECGIHGWWQSRKNRRHAETIEGPSIERLTRLAGQLNIILAVGMTELEGDKAFITHVLIGPGGVMGRHRKTALGDPPGRRIRRRGRRGERGGSRRGRWRWR